MFHLIQLTAAVQAARLAGRSTAMTSLPFTRLYLYVPSTGSAMLDVSYWSIVAKTRMRYRSSGTVRSVFTRSMYFAMIVLSEGKHYLIGFDDKRKKITAYRISRMEEVKNTYEPRDNEEKFKFIGISDYARQTFGMFIGSRAKRITMICHNNLLDTMIERFGTSTATYKKKDEDHFTITTGIVVSPQFYGWLLGLGGLAVIEDSGEEDSVAKKYLRYIETMKEIQQKSVE